MAERSGDLWASFQHDPRDPAVAPLRASDADRNVVHGVLTDAFADGRLDREEYDDRTAATLQARTLGELPALVADLVPDRPLLASSSPRVPLVAASSTDIQKRAEDKWREDRAGLHGFCRLGRAHLGDLARDGLGRLDDFPWPLIVNAVAFMNVVRVAANRGDIVADEVQRLERKQAKAIESRKKKQPGP